MCADTTKNPGKIENVDFQIYYIMKNMCYYE